MPALVIGHRTLPRHAPENSLEGIRRAAELGADVRGWLPPQTASGA